MMAILRVIVGLVITLIVAAFAVLNRGTFDVYWSPFPADLPINLPVYVVVLGAMAFGFLVGALMVWMNAGVLRTTKRRQKKEIKILQQEVGTLKETRFSSAPPAQDLFPALTAQGKR